MSSDNKDDPKTVNAYSSFDPSDKKAPRGLIAVSRLPSLVRAPLAPLPESRIEPPEYIREALLKDFLPISDDMIEYLKHKRFANSEESVYATEIRNARERECAAEPVLWFWYRHFRREDLIERHEAKWIVGNRLIAKWDADEDILRGIILARLPVYQIMPDEKTFERLDNVRPKGSTRYYGKAEPDPLSLPENWWFNLEEVSFYERLHPDLYLYGSEDSPWYSATHLLSTGTIGFRELREWIEDKGLIGYILTRKGLKRILPDYIHDFGFHGVLFHIHDLGVFSQKYPDLVNRRKNRIKEMVQNFAKQKFQGQRPTLAAMYEATLNHFKHRPLLKKNGEPYSESAIKGWLRELKMHDPDPGRR